jgi:hypothetical protein
MNSVRGIGWLCCGWLIAAAAGCAGFAPGQTAETLVSKSFTAPKGTKVLVRSFNGAVQAGVGEDAEVEAKVIKRGSGRTKEEAEADLANVEVSFEQEADTIKVVARRKAGSPAVANSGAAVSLTVPAGTVLEFETSNGPVTVTGPVGDVSVKSSNGDVSVKGTKGDLKLSSSNAWIKVEGGTGRVDVATSNGSVRVEAAQARVTARTTNGPVEFTGSLADGDNEFETSNGPVTVALPASAAFRLDAHTSNADIDSDFEVRNYETRRGPGRPTADLRGDVGDKPAMRVRVRTSNGSVTVKKLR